MFVNVFYNTQVNASTKVKSRSSFVSFCAMAVKISEIRGKLKNPKTTVITIRKLPAYLNLFVKEDREVLFIYRDMNNDKKKMEIISKQATTDAVDDLDITGEPMEAPRSAFDSLNLSDTFETLMERCESNDFFPLPVVEARTLLSHCALAILPSMPVWIVTDSSDVKKTVLMSNEINSNWRTRSWVLDLGFISPPSLESLETRHSNLFNCPPHLANCEAKCLYLIKKETLIDNPSLLHVLITLQSSWLKKSLEPPLSHRSTETRLFAQVRIGSSFGGLKVIWEQLCLLDRYLNMTLDIRSGVSSLIGPLPSSTALLECLGRTQSEHSPPSARIGSMLMEPVKTTLAPETFTLHQLVKWYSGSKNLPDSLTDRIWMLLIECKTNQELLECLEELLRDVRKKSAHAPFLGTDNMTRLGKSLLEGVEFGIYSPLEYLAEMGLEKLKREMLLIFSKAKIATANNLNIPKFPNFREIPSAKWMQTARKWHLWLCQVYCVLEVFCNVQETLGLSNKVLYSIASNLIQNYTGPNSKITSFSNLIENPVQEMESLIPAKNVETFILKRSPEEWAFSLSNSTDKMKCQSTIIKTSKNCFPHAVNTSILDNSSGDDYMYHWYEYGMISQYYNSNTNSNSNK